MGDHDRDRGRGPGPPTTPVPAWVSPMLATLADRAFDDEAWVFERKLDGVRCLAFRDGDDVWLRSRTRKVLDNTYPELVDVLRAQPATRFVVDGEIVAFEGGRTSFARLQQRLGINDPARARRSPVPVYFYGFDLLHLEGHDTTSLPLRARKAFLRRAIEFEDPLRFSPHRNGDGRAFLEDACRRGWEGLVAKRANSAYAGRRSRDWLKLKCSARQEFVVGGFTDPEGTRAGFGALLVGYYDGPDLVYAGKVGTGYTDAFLRELRRRLDRLEAPASPFDRGDTRARGVHWVRPELVAEVAFTEWTADGKLRHSRFRGLRDDKRPGEIVRERPTSAP